MYYLWKSNPNSDHARELAQILCAQIPSWQSIYVRFAAGINADCESNIKIWLKLEASKVGWKSRMLTNRVYLRTSQIVFNILNKGLNRIFGFNCDLNFTVFPYFSNYHLCHFTNLKISYCFYSDSNGTSRKIESCKHRIKWLVET